MYKGLKSRLVSAACAFGMLLSSFAGMQPVYAVPEEENQELSRQSFELYPNGEDADQMIALEGMMPEGASASAVDVSEEYDGIAAYDITITDGEEDYQPGGESPVMVEINDPAIPDSGNVQLWHICDNGVRQQITDFELEDGRITFYAEAFSVYEIVELGDISFSKAESMEQLEEKGRSGVYLGICGGTYFLTDHEEGNVGGGTSTRKGITKTKEPSDNTSKPNTAYRTIDTEIYWAAKYYFSDVVFNSNKTAITSCKIYCLDGNTPKYLKQSDRSLLFASGESDATYFKVERVNGDADPTHFIIVGSDSYCINMQGGVNGSAFAAYNNKTDVNARLSVWYPIDSGSSDDLKIGGKTYGLMNYTGGTHGFALMADEEGRNVHTLIQLVTHQTSGSQGKILYVDEGSEVTRWTFHSKGGNRYTVSEGGKYLAVSGGKLVLADSENDAAVFTAAADSKGRIQLSCSGGYITFKSEDTGEENLTSFTLETAASENSWLSLLSFADLEESDLITYSADRISISRAENGQKVIVYTRIWNENTKRYDIYAVDHNGTLCPCYASGGKILWLGDGTGSLEWEFTEYLDEATKEPNYYYELYNPYSEKYIAPQLGSGQLLSDSTIGINMPGRRSGDFYSDIIAWDNSRYAFVGMKPSEDNSRLVPCAESASVPFYFASLEELNLSDRLHTVNTVDNNDFGITMKMKDFSGTSGGTGATEQNGYLKNTTFVSESATKGLLSNHLVNGYPTATLTNRSFADLYSGAETVNHLFIESVYNSSGYFEFDSCQNFATLKATNDNNFTVYRELGTSDGEIKSTLKHGQFYPYNTISVGNYSSDNPLNLYNTDARVGNLNLGYLSEDDPRKYERLYTAGHKDGKDGKDKIDYYFGMELGAEFVQTVSGLDSWGHDIIFEFTGDDDFWLYVDDELVIDLGGIHSALSGNVNFRTGEVYVNGAKSTLKQIFIDNFTARYKAEHSGAAPSDEAVSEYLLEYFQRDSTKPYGCENVFADYSKHKMTIFYMERGAGASNLHMRFNLASVVPGHVVVKKSVTGEGADQIDKSMVEYPFQIFYTEEGEDGGEGEEKQLMNDSEHISVKYQNSTQPVRFVREYYPPGKDTCYKNIYYLNPTKDAEIYFPDNAIKYRIVECAVDPVVYGVAINGEVKTSLEPGESYSQAYSPQNPVYEIAGLLNVSSDKTEVSNLPVISFDNQVNKDVIRTLEFTKRIMDSEDESKEILDDTTKFKFRLSLGTAYDGGEGLSLADRTPYYVVDPDGYFCRYDPDTGDFVPTAWTYKSDEPGRVKTDPKTLTDEERDSITFRTSIYGTIDRIPSRYTVCVPNLPAGTVFKVEERPNEVPPGYGLYRYEHIMGRIIDEYGAESIVPSYDPVTEGADNLGVVIPAQDPQLEIENKKGYGLTVNKKWSDTALTTGHSAVYTAVYVDGELLENSVRQIASPAASV